MKVLLIFSDKLVSRFMQDADIFEPFKVFVKPVVEATVVEGWGPENIEVMRNFEGNYQLVAVVGENFVWTDPAVKVVSFGDTFTMLDEYVEHLQMMLRASKWKIGLNAE